MKSVSFRNFGFVNRITRYCPFYCATLR